MSETVFPALSITPYDPYTPMAKLAQIGQANVATQGQQLTNENTALGLQVAQARTAPMLAYLRQQAGGGAAGGGAGSSGALAPLAAPGAAPAAGAQSGLASMAIPSPGGQPASPNAAPAAQAGTPASAPGDIGEALYGVAMPPLQALSLGTDPKALDGVLKARSAVLYQYAQSATPVTWDSHVSDLMQQGWLSSKMGSQLLGHPELQPRILQSLASPDAGLSATTTMLGQGLTTDVNGNPVPSGAAASAKGAIAGAEATGRNQSDLQYKPAIDQAENGPLADRAAQTAKATLGYDVTKAQAAPYNLKPGDVRVNPAIPGGANADGTNQPARGVDLLNTGAMPASAYAARVNGSENATGNPNAQNPRSSATGNGQFISGTWLPLIRQTRPDLAGLSDQQLLALRGNPGIAAQMTAAYGQQNAAVLQQNGLPVTSATLGMAHRLGPSDAMAVMNADPNKPLAAVLSGDVMAANPDLAQQTVGSFVRSSANRYGNQPVAFAQPAVASRVPPPPSPGNSPTGGPSPFGVGQTPQARIPLAHADERFPAPNLAVQPPDTPPNPHVPVPADGGYAPVVPPARQNGGAVAPAAGVQAQPAAPPAGPIVTPLPDGGTSVTSPLTPATLEQQRADIGAMASYRQGLVADAQHAVQTNSLVDGMRADALNFAQGGGMNATWREMSEDLNNVSTAFGGKPIASVANWEAFNKAAGQLVREAASGVSSQVGAQELGMIQKTLLSDQTSAAGFQKIADQLQGIADYKIAKSAASGSAAGNPNAFEGAWAQHVTPLAFIVNRMSSSDAQQLATGLQKTEQGRTLLKSLSTQMAYADQAGLFRMLP